MENYMLAVDSFNSLRSFNIFYPDDDEDINNQLIKYTNVIHTYVYFLKLYQNHCNITGTVDNEISTTICAFVVHINQLTNKLKDYDENDQYLKTIE